jgi:cyclophilin family peptidyl-prolyl cis-trans isomerase
MKKIILLCLIGVALSACGGNSVKTTINEKSAPQSANNTLKEEEKMKSDINNIRNGATPKVAPKQESKPLNQQNSQKADTPVAEENKIQQENLVSQFSGAVIKTNQGNITVKFYGQESPITVNNFMNLAKQGFYIGTKFHRVIKDFMIQGGDPNSKDDDWSNDGMGGPGYKFQDEFNQHQLVKGSLAMANSGPNTNGSQFFIVTKESTPWLDGKHTNFGEVVEGMEVVAKIEAAEANENDHPIEDMTVNSVELVK